MRAVDYWLAGAGTPTARGWQKRQKGHHDCALRLGLPPLIGRPP